MNVMKNVFKNRPVKNPLFWTGVIYIVYLASAFFLLPYVAKKKAVEYIGSEFGRELEIEKISFNPFTLKLTVKNLIFHEPDGGTFIKWEEFSVDPALFPLVKKSIVLQDISLISSQVSLIKMKDGTFNFSTLIKEDKSKVDEPSAEKSDWKLVIESLRLHNVGILYKDNTYDPQFSIDLLNISIDTKNIVFDGSEESKTKLNFDFEGGGSLALEGDFIINPLSTNFNIRLKDIDLTAFNTILSNSSDMVIKKGIFNSDINLSLKDNFEKQRPDLLLKGSFDFNDLSLNESINDSNLVSFANFSTTIASLSLDPLKLNISEVKLNKFYADIINSSDSKLNVLTALRIDGSKSESDSLRSDPAGGVIKPEIFIRKVIFTENRIDFTDFSRKPLLKNNINSLNLNLENINLFRADSSAFEMNFKIAESDTNSITGYFRHEPLYAGIKTHLKNIDLSFLNSFFPPEFKVKLGSGKFSADLDTDYDPTDKTSQIKSGGNIFLNDFSFVDNGNKELIGWKEISINDLSFENEPLKSRISLIKLKNFRSDIVISKEKVLNLAAAFGSEGTDGDSTHAQAEKDTAAAPSKKLDVVIKKVSLENNSIRFADFSLPLPFATSIEKINSSINNIDLNSKDRTNISFKGVADKSGTAAINGDIYLMEPLKNSQMKIDFEKISLIQYSPYSAKYVGNYIDTGSLSLYIQYNILNSTLTSENKILIDKIKFGKDFDSEDEINLPIKLAIALLKDKNGLIDFDIEVSGDLSDPKINTGSLIWQALKKVLTSIATSPIRFLANSLGLDNADSYEFIDFALGETALSEPETKKLDDLSRALNEKPDLKLSVTGTASRRYDKATIQDRKLRKLISGESKRPYDSLKTTERKAVLEKLIARFDTTANIDSLMIKYSVKEKKSLKLDTLKYNSKLYSLIRSNQPVDDIEVIVLTTERSNAIRSHLTEKDSVSEEQIIILPGEITGEEKIMTVRTKLSIDLK
jgi:hypothetical protein